MGLGLGRIPWYELRSITGLLSSQVFGGQDTELIPTRILPAIQDITSILTCRYHNPAFSRPVVEEASNIQWHSIINFIQARFGKYIHVSILCICDSN